MKRADTECIPAGAEVFVRVDDNYFGRKFWVLYDDDGYELVTPEEADEYEIELTPARCAAEAERLGREALILARSCGYDFGALAVTYWAYDEGAGSMLEVKPCREGGFRPAARR